VTDKHSRALVLGGGGVAGIAWETGMLAGLADTGVDVTDAGLVVGTSAGATVAAQVSSSKPLGALYDDQVNGTGAPEPTVHDVDPVVLLAEVREILGSGGDPQAIRRRIGAVSLAQDRVPVSERRALIEARLPDHEWPARRLAITTVDAETGEFVVLTNTSDVDLVDAVAASFAIPRVWPDVIGFPETSDVEQVSAPLLTITPDEASQAGLRNLLDPDSRAICARAGYGQGQRIAAEVKAFWV
jgi:NTE family protein